MKYLVFTIIFTLIAGVAFDSTAQQFEPETDQFGKFLKKNKNQEEEEGDDDDWRNEDTYETVEEKMKFFKEKYEDTLDIDFESLWQICQESITEFYSCQVGISNQNQDSEGFLRGKIESDFCIYTQGKDSTWKNMQFYSQDPPFIRGGVWVTGRIQYKMMLRELETGESHLRIVGEMSGFEEYVTNKVHYWKSTGYFEHHMLEKIKEKVANF